MAKKGGLGKGLSALLEEAESQESQAPVTQEAEQTGVQVKTVSASDNLPAGIEQDENKTLWVNPALLKPNPRQPRQYFDQEKLAELTESVRRDGVLIPVIIEDAGDGSFYIIAGERRTRAAKAAGLERIPVQLRKYTESQKLEVALIENIQRTDLNPIEEAQAYYNLMELDNITQDEVATRVGKNRSTVANSVRLLKLPEDMQHALASGSITSGHARALLAVVNPADQRVLFGKIMGQGMSVRQAEAEAGLLNGGSRAAKEAGGSAPKQDSRDPNYVAIEQKFIEVLGAKVKLKGNFNKGSITIDYYTKDDLNRIYEVIVGK
ncbi:MAG: ParB/RepB/Spo0J family partition protein [Treponema sp.]|nr:ParB/RepB/Spo0J family partition protein [Treponema sp.]